jgi:hypothetical protein
MSSIALGSAVAALLLIATPWPETWSVRNNSNTAEMKIVYFFMVSKIGQKSNKAKRDWFGFYPVKEVLIS